MAGLACGEVSPLAWEIVDAGASAYVAVDDRFALDAMRALASPAPGDPAIVAGETGASGLAALLAAAGPRRPSPATRARRVVAGTADRQRRRHRSGALSANHRERRGTHEPMRARAEWWRHRSHDDSRSSHRRRPAHVAPVRAGRNRTDRRRRLLPPRADGRGQGRTRPRRRLDARAGPRGRRRPHRQRVRPARRPRAARPR